MGVGDVRPGAKMQEACRETIPEFAPLRDFGKREIAAADRQAFRMEHPHFLDAEDIWIGMLAIAIRGDDDIEVRMIGE